MEEYSAKGGKLEEKVEEVQEEPEQLRIEDKQLSADKVRGPNPPGLVLARVDHQR